MRNKNYSFEDLAMMLEDMIKNNRMELIDFLGPHMDFIMKPVLASLDQVKKAIAGEEFNFVEELQRDIQISSNFLLERFVLAEANEQQKEFVYLVGLLYSNIATNMGIDSIVNTVATLNVILDYQRSFLATIEMSRVMLLHYGATGKYNGPSQAINEAFLRTINEQIEKGVDIDGRNNSKWKKHPTE